MLNMLKLLLKTNLPIWEGKISKHTVKKELTPTTLNSNNRTLENIAKLLITTNERGGSDNAIRGFKAIKINKLLLEGGIIHHKQFFVTDLETLNFNKVETPFIIGSIIINNSKVTKEHLITSTELNNPNSSKNLLLRTLDFYVNNSKGNRIYVFIHNGAKFDAKVLLPVLTELSKEESITIRNVLADGMSTLFEIKFRYKGKTIILRDSIKLLGASVASLGKTYLNNQTESKINMNIQEFQNWFIENPLNLTNLNNKGYIRGLGISEEDFINTGRTSIINYISKYCIIDCKVVALSLVKFSKSIASKGFIINIEGILTISSVAMKVYTTFFYNKFTTPIASIPSHTFLRKYLKNSYIGGRTEVLGSGININNVYHFDIPGMYAQCMNIPLPYGNPVYVKDFIITPKEVISKLHRNNIIGFISATVSCPKDLWLPVLGHKVNGKLLFNTGTFSGTWTSHELELALEIGYTVKLNTAFLFLTNNILKRYSSTITTIKNEARETGDTVTRAIAKLLRNSLYGKFAASYHDNTSKIVSDDELAFYERNYEINASYNIDNNHWLITYNTKPLNPSRLIEPHIQEVKNKLNVFEAPKPVNIAIRSAITSYGRIILYKLWIDVINQGGTLLYSDTDSVFAAFDEAPYGKTFNGFVWPEDPKGTDTFNKVLFIAPKIYYLERVSGNVKFAVKGVSNTKGFIYEDLIQIFVNKEKLVFKNQVKFRTLTKGGVVKGINVNNNLTKTYDIFASVKREWVWNGELLSTIPTRVKRDTTIKSLPQEFKKIENKRALITNLNSEFKWTQTTQTDIDFGKQFITDAGDINIVINMNGELQQGFYHTTATIIANNQNIETNNVKRVVVTLLDRSRNIFKTVVHIDADNWRNYRINNLMEIINEKIITTLLEYQDAFNPTTVSFKVMIRNNPILVNPDNNIEIAYDLSTTSISRKTQKLQYLQKQIELITEQENLLKGSIDLPEDRQLSEEDIINYKGWKNQVKEIIKERIARCYKIENVDKDSNQAKILTDKVILAFYKVFEESGRITLHSLAEKIIDFIHADRYREERVKNVLIVSWAILSELTFKNLLSTYKMKSQNIKTKTSTLHTSHTFFIRTKSSLPAALIITNRYIISKISLTPFETNIPKDFSKDIQYTLNKLNSTPVILNISYLQFLLKLSYEDIFTMIDLKTPEEMQSIGLTWANSKIILLAIGKWYESNNKGHFYMKYIHDFRGRLYPELTHIRHISHKFLRPLFVPKDSPSFNNRILTELLRTGHSDNRALINWFNIIKQIPDMESLLRIKSNNIIMRCLKTYIDEITKTNVNWTHIARITELIELLKEGGVIIPSPVEYDAKARVLQHAAAISGNDKILAILGMVEKEGVNKEDIYLKTAELLIKKIQTWRVEELTRDKPSSDTIVSSLEKIIEDLSTLSNEALRSLAKKPLITKAYNASHSRLLDYVKVELKNSKLTWRSELIRLFIIALKATITDVIINEIRLMKKVQRLVKNVNVPYGWTIRPNSDFTVYCNNPIKETRDVNLKSPLSGYELHTTINILKQGQNILKNRNRIFVNIIHSIDALHIALIIKHTSNQILPIHDAILVAIGTNLDSIQETINETFKRIHEGNKTFIRIIEQLETQTGNVSGITFVKNLEIKESFWVQG